MDTTYKTHRRVLSQACESIELDFDIEDLYSYTPTQDVNGYTLDQIAEIYNFTPDYIRRVFNKRNIKSASRYDIPLLDLNKMFLRSGGGYTVQELSGFYGISEREVRRRLDKYDIPTDLKGNTLRYNISSEKLRDIIVDEVPKGYISRDGLVSFLPKGSTAIGDVLRYNEDDLKFVSVRGVKYYKLCKALYDVVMG